MTYTLVYTPSTAEIIVVKRTGPATLKPVAQIEFETPADAADFIEAIRKKSVKVERL